MNGEVAAQRIASLFDDGGKAVLASTGMGPGWAGALRATAVDLSALPADASGLQVLTALRDALASAPDVGPALGLTRALLDLRTRTHGPDHPDTLVELGALGALEQRAGRIDEGALRLRRAYDGLAAQRIQDLRIAVVAASLAVHHARAGRFGEAEPLLAESYAIRARLAPDTTARVAAQLGEARLRLGRGREAAPLYEEAWRAFQREYGPDDPRTVTRARAYGALLNELGEHHQAVAPLREAVEHLAEGEERALVQFELGVALDALGRREEGLRLVEDSVRWTRRAGGPHPDLARRLTKLANLQIRRGRTTEAEGLLREALEADLVLHGDDSPEVAARYAALGEFCARAGRRAEALGWLDPAASLLRSALGDDDPRTRAVVAYWLGLVAQQADEARQRRDRALAAELVRRAWAVAVPVLGHGHRDVARLRAVAQALAIRL